MTPPTGTPGTINAAHAPTTPSPASHDERPDTTEMCQAAQHRARVTVTTNRGPRTGVLVYWPGDTPSRYGRRPRVQLDNGHWLSPKPDQIRLETTRAAR